MNFQAKDMTPALRDEAEQWFGKRIVPEPTESIVDSLLDQFIFLPEEAGQANQRARRSHRNLYKLRIFDEDRDGPGVPAADAHFVQPQATATGWHEDTSLLSLRLPDGCDTLRGASGSAGPEAEITRVEEQATTTSKASPSVSISRRLHGSIALEPRAPSWLREHELEPLPVTLRSRSSVLRAAGSAAALGAIAILFAALRRPPRGSVGEAVRRQNRTPLL